MASKKKDALRATKEQELGDYLAFLSQELDIRAERKVNRSALINMSREHLFLTHLEGVAEKIADKIRLPPVGYSKKVCKVETMRDLTLILSDLHFRANLTSAELPYQYGPKEEARRLAAVVAQVAEYKRQHRKNTTLVINILGDIIHNQLHDARDGKPLAEQCMAAIFLLNRAIWYLAAEFPEVIIYCNPGNHGRNTKRHENKAIHQKWDSIESIIYFALKESTRHLRNVRVEIPLTPYILYESFGQHVFATHGDTVLRPGNPGATINVKNLELQINKINAARPDGKKINLAIVGHVHVASYVRLPNKVDLITNAALIPADAFAVSIGQLETACGQTLFESVPEHPVGDYRFIEVGPDTDEDSSLDLIIPPFLAL